MRRRFEVEEDDTPGGDSFLDIVANIVGILVLLVVVVGVRAAGAVVMPEAPKKSDLAEIEAATRETRIALNSSQQDLARAAKQIALSRDENLMKETARLTYAEIAEGMRDDIQALREELDEHDQESFDENRRLARARLELDRLNQKELALMTAPEPESETIEFDTTPIVRERVKDEVYLRLREDRVCYLPVVELKNEVEANIDAFRSALASSPGEVATIERVVGPVDGFRLRCVFQRRAVRTPQGIHIAGGLLAARLEESMPPESRSVESMLDPSSPITARLASVDPEKTVVTLAVYADSFDIAPEVERRLRESGFRVAKSLLRNETQITFSPHGRETVLQ